MPRRESVDLESRQWIAALLARQMKAMGLTAADVSRRTGLGEGTLSTLFKGQVKGLGLDTVLKIHRGMGISGELLLGKPDWQMKGITRVGGLSEPPLSHPAVARHGSSR
jgi:transcriptional regulator with XRE-family HTH domain